MIGVLFLFLCLIFGRCASSFNISQNFNHVENVNVSSLSLFAEKAYQVFDIRDTLCSDLENLLETRNVSTTCSKQLEIVCKNQTLLWTMFDATSKFPYPGLTVSTRQDLGNYDQCLTVDNSENGIRTLGKMCAFGLLIPELPITTDNLTVIIDTAFKLAICIPDACSADDLVALTTYPLFSDSACTTVETGTDYDAGDISALVVFSCFACIMILSTSYDSYTRRTEQKQKPLFLAFSVLTNGEKLFQSSSGTNREQILSFHGMKFISMLWIIAGHGFVAWQSYPVSNQKEVNQWLYIHRYAFYINTSHLAVDTFFFISGFLLSYQYLKQKPVSFGSHLKRVPQLYLHRYLRLTPALAMVFFFALTLNKHMVRGPLAVGVSESLVEPCKTYWWSFFLYLQNYYNRDQMCINQTWYLSADMQLFIISPLVMIPIALVVKKHFKASIIGMICLNIIFTGIPIFTTLVYKDYQNEYDTHSRLVDYFCGFMLGMYMREKKDSRFPFSKVANLIMWFLALGGMIAIIMIYQEEFMNGTYDSQCVFYGLMRPAWAIGLSWIIYSCHHGHGGFVNWILCLPICQIGSRLTYCMYLVHGNVIVWYLLLVQNRVHFSDYEAYYLFCGNFITSFTIAMVWSLAFESPLMTIEKIIFGRGGRRPRVQKTEPAP